MTRYLTSYLNRFLSPDDIVPDPYNPLDWDRYSYVQNNPVNRVDPDGHAAKDPDGGCGLTACINSFQQDLLAVKIFMGSNDDGSWNWKDRSMSQVNGERMKTKMVYTIGICLFLLAILTTCKKEQNSYEAEQQKWAQKFGVNIKDYPYPSTFPVY